MSADRTIEDATQLREAYRQPGQGALDKVIDVIDDGAAAFIAAAPLFVMASATKLGADASPRGGPPGFVRTLDRRRLAWGDLVGNNRLDSFGNLLENPNVGLLFLVPGVLETLRVNGTASLVRDADVLAACAVDGRTPNTAVVVTVEECYIHCGAALRRSELWNAATWPEPGDVPAPAAIMKAHMGSERPADEIESGLHQYYDNHVWTAGGIPDPLPE